MTEDNDATVWIGVDFEDIEELQILSKEVPDADARSMYDAAEKDPNAIVRDLYDTVAVAVPGAFLYVGCSYPDEVPFSDVLKFPTTQAFDAFERYFGFAAEDVRAALDPRNIAALADADRRGGRGYNEENIKSVCGFSNEHLERIRAKHVATQEALKEEIRRELEESEEPEH